jgi:hypothetical protein
MTEVRLDTYTILIVNKLNLLYLKSLPLIQVLLLFQNTIIEKLLKFFIAVIDAELLKAIDSEIFWETRINKIRH